MKSICILGLGYIGLPTATMFATHGCRVYGVDINKEIIEILNHGGIHIEEPDLTAMVQAAIKSGNLLMSSQPQPADAFIIAVPTPFKQNEFGEYEGKKYKLADMSAVESAAEAIVPYLQKGNLVILESTSPVRTTIDLVSPILEKSGLKAGEDFYLAYSPERVLPGQILKELIENDRVIGGIDKGSAEKGKELYLAFVKGEIVLTDSTTAEMVKLMENTFRDVNIALANEFALVAESVGFDVWNAIEIANHHPRVNILKPGPGVGGHCIAIDPWFIVEKTPDLTPLIQCARRVNDGMPAHVVNLVKRALTERQSRTTEQVNLSAEEIRASFSENLERVACLGLTYKANVDDIRESPAVKVIELLRDAKFQVSAYDPHVKTKMVPEQVDTLEAVLEKAGVVVVLTDHSEFRQLPIIALERGGRTVIDLHHCLIGPNSDGAAHKTGVEK